MLQIAQKMMPQDDLKMKTLLAKRSILESLKPGLIDPIIEAAQAGTYAKINGTIAMQDLDKRARELRVIWAKSGQDQLAIDGAIRVTERQGITDKDLLNDVKEVAELVFGIIIDLEEACCKCPF